MIWGRNDGLGAADRALSGIETMLREGEFRDLPEAMEGLERAMLGLQSGGLDQAAASRLTDLRARASRMGELLNAVMSGMRDARAVMAAPTGFSSYDAAGRSGHIGQARTRFERRR